MSPMPAELAKLEASSLMQSLGLRKRFGNCSGRLADVVDKSRREARFSICHGGIPSNVAVLALVKGDTCVAFGLRQRTASHTRRVFALRPGFRIRNIPARDDRHLTLETLNGR